MKIRSRQNWKLDKKDLEKPQGKSLTVPDDSFTIRQILEKFTHGVDPQLSKVGHYPDDDDLDDDEKHDQEDLEDLGRQDYGEKMDRYLESHRTQANIQKSRTKKVPPEEPKTPQEPPKTQ